MTKNKKNCVPIFKIKNIKNIEVEQSLLHGLIFQIILYFVLFTYAFVSFYFVLYCFVLSYNFFLRFNFCSFDFIFYDVKKKILKCDTKYKFILFEIVKKNYEILS